MINLVHNKFKKKLRPQKKIDRGILYARPTLLLSDKLQLLKVVTYIIRASDFQDLFLCSHTDFKLKLYN